MNTLGNFTITIEDSRKFARASGDYNPLHLDPVAARRTQFGQTLIHGVCGTLKALDLFLEMLGQAIALLSLKVKYSKPAAQGQNLAAFFDTHGELTRIEVFADGTRCQIIEVTTAPRPSAPPDESHQFIPVGESADACTDLAIEACKDLCGKVDLAWDQQKMAALFPSATRYLPTRQLAVLLASTRIVGMRCPGLHSVFAQLDLRFPQRESGSGTNDDSTLAYQVLSFDQRINRVELSLESGPIEGTIEAFFRSPPVNQASFAKLSALVTHDEFHQQHALVIGASRGLGEMITKLLAAGGAKVVMSYATGREDAIRVASEIAQHRAQPTVIAYNALDGSIPADLSETCASLTHIYYLASPSIKKSDGGVWDQRLFARYCSYYIDGLASLLQQVNQYRPVNRELRLFIPSSIFLEQNPKGFDEYIAAKAAAEAFARCYQTSHRNCLTFAPRLPRLHTDQTAGVKGIDELKTIEVIVAQLRTASSNTTNASSNVQ